MTEPLRPEVVPPPQPPPTEIHQHIHIHEAQPQPQYRRLTPQEEQAEINAYWAAVNARRWKTVNAWGLWSAFLIVGLGVILSGGSDGPAGALIMFVIVYCVGAFFGFFASIGDEIAGNYHDNVRRNQRR